MPPPVPRPLVLVAAAVCVAGAVMLIWGAVTVGVTTDEPIHVERFSSYLQTGWYVADFQARAGVPLPGVSDQYVYGPATMWLLHHWTVLWGAEPRGAVAVTAQAYALRHLGVALISVAGVAAVAVTARMILGRWSWGLVAAACLLATPMFLGHAMFNVKDPAVAAGYAITTAGLVRWAGPGRHRPMARLTTVATVAGGSWLMLGTRPGMWLALVCSLAATVILVALRRDRDRGTQPGPGWRHLDLVAALALADLGLVWLYPEVFGDPLEMAQRSAAGSANFLDHSASRLFVPVRMLLLMPLGLLALLVVAVLITTVRLGRQRLRAETGTVQLAIVGVQLVALPIASVVHSTGLSTDLRQMLFIIPAAAIFVASALAWLVARAAKQRRVGVRRVVTALACAAIVVPTVDGATLFPFTYAYANPLVTAVGWQSIAPGDFYQASQRLLVDDIPAATRVVCSPLLTSGGEALAYGKLAANADCRTDRSGLLYPYRGEGAQVDTEADTRVETGVEAQSEHFVAVYAGAHTPVNCDAQAQVSRRHGWRTWVLSELATCTVVTKSLAAGQSAGEAALMPFMSSGWGLDLRARGTSARLDFRLAEPGVVAVEVREWSTGGSTARIDGTAVDLPHHGRLVVADLRPGTHRLAFQARQGHTLDLTLVRLLFTPVR